MLIRGGSFYKGTASNFKAERCLALPKDEKLGWRFSGKVT